MSHRIPAIALTLVWFWVSEGVPVAVSADKATDEKTSDEKATMDDLFRGLKGAAQNIEREIPKIIPALEQRLKQWTGKGDGKPSQEPDKEKK